MFSKKRTRKSLWQGAMLLIGKMVLLALAFTVLLISVSNGFMYMSARNKIVSLSDADSLEGDCILVLGCGMRPDGTPSQMLRDRLDVAIELYFMGISDRLLMSGGPGRGTWNEANAMKRYAVERGVPSEKIFMDHAGLSTYESMQRAEKVFGCKRIVITTQRYHLYRALFIAESMGMHATGIDVDTRAYARQQYYDIRETAARTKDTLLCLFRLQIAQEGSPISLSGNGNTTNNAGSILASAPLTDQGLQALQSFWKIYHQEMEDLIANIQELPGGQSRLFAVSVEAQSSALHGYTGTMLENAIRSDSDLVKGVIKQLSANDGYLRSFGLMEEGYYFEVTQKIEGRTCRYVYVPDASARLSHNAEAILDDRWYIESYMW